MNTIKDILTPDFFDTYYTKSKMDYRQIADMLQNEGHQISLSSVKKYGKKFDVGRSRSECKRSLDWETSLWNSKIAEIVDGLVLSDASITPAGQVAVTVQYEEFRDYCSSLFESYQPCKLKCYPNKNAKPYFRFCTKMHPDIQKQRKRWYPKGKKTIPNNIKITPLSVLLWYLGDGHLDARWGNIFLHTNSFVPTDVSILVDILRGKGIECKSYQAKKQGTYNRDYRS